MGIRSRRRTSVDYGIPRFEVQGYTFGRLYAGPLWGSTTPAILAQNTYEARDTVIQTIGTVSTSSSASA